MSSLKAALLAAKAKQQSAVTTAHEAALQEIATCHPAASSTAADCSQSPPILGSSCVDADLPSVQESSHPTQDSSLPPKLATVTDRTEQAQDDTAPLTVGRLDMDAPCHKDEEPTVAETSIKVSSVEYLFNKRQREEATTLPDDPSQRRRPSRISEFAKKVRSGQISF